MITGDVEAIHLSGSPGSASFTVDDYWNDAHLEVDYVEFAAVPGVIGVVSDSGTDSRPLPPGPIQIKPNGQDPEILLRPTATLARAELTAPVGDILSAPATTLRFSHAFDETTTDPSNPALPEAPEAAVANSMAVQVPAADLSASGAMEVALWGFNLTTVTGSYWSGETSLNEVQSRQQILRALLTPTDTINGVADDANLRVYLTNLTILGTGSIELQAPTVPGTQDLLGGVLRMEGGIHLEAVQWTDSGFVIQIQDAGETTLDGQSVTVNFPHATPPWTGWLLAAAVLGLATTTGIAWRRSPTARLRQMETRLANQNYEWVARRAGPALRSEKTGRKAALLKATSLLALGEFQEARLFLASLHRDRRPDPATFHFLTAHAAAGVGQNGVAARELAECLDLDPTYAKEAEAIEALRTVLRAAGEPPPSDSGESYA